MGDLKKDIQADFTGTSVMFDLTKFQNIAVKRIKTALQSLGEDIVNDAKDKSMASTYTDRTSALRNSIGYKVTNKTVGSDFLIDSNGAGISGKKASEGMANAAALLNELRDENGEISLFVVAGMDYAAPVEALEGHSVLSGSIPPKSKVEKHFKEQLGDF